MIAGFATFFNVAIIYYKFNEGLLVNGAIDLAALALVMYVFQGSFSALAVGVIASSLFSLFLIFKPIDATKFEDW